MKFIQVNAWGGRLIRTLLELIKAESPDVVFSQEVFSYPGPLTFDSPWNSLATFQDIVALGYPHSAFAPSNQFEVFGRELSFGNAVFSKTPLQHQSTHYTGGPGPIHEDDPAHYNHNDGRNFQHVTIGAGPTQLHLINHHGHWLKQPLGDQTSMDRLQQVAHYTNQLTGPKIVAGDLNLIPDSPAVSAFTNATGLRSLLAGAAVTTTLSAAHHVSRPIICDYVFASPELQATRIEASDRLVSDHKAIVFELDVAVPKE